MRNLRAVLFFALALSCFCVGRLKGKNVKIRSHWLFVQYHKTGHELANHFSSHFNGDNCTAVVSRIKSDTTTGNVKLFYNNHITIRPRRTIHTNWFDLLNTDEHTFRVLHFVRNPYELLVSSLVYHSQEKVPPGESWLQTPLVTWKPFEYNQTELSKYSTLLSSLRGENGSSIIDKYFSNAMTYCGDLWNKSRTNSTKNNISFHKLLKFANTSAIPNLGIRLEACRFLLPTAAVHTGDGMFMASNALFEDKRVSKRVFMSDLPVGNKTVWLDTATAIYSHLMQGAHKGDSKPFWQCKTVAEAVAAVEESAYTPEAPTLREDKKPLHVTTGLLSSAEKAAHIHALKADPVLSPLLNLIEDALKVYN